MNLPLFDKSFSFCRPLFPGYWRNNKLIKSTNTTPIISSIIICFYTFKKKITLNETKNVSPLQTIMQCWLFLCQKKYYLFPTLVTSHTLTLFFRIDKSANSFTNISLFVIHFLLVYTFQVTQEITNSLYIDIFNKISLNKTNKEAPLQAQCSFCCEKYKSKRSLVTYGGELFRWHFFSTGKIKDSHDTTVKKSYINITKLKTIHVARYRSTCEAELTMYKILANGRKTKPSCSHNNISNAGNTQSDLRTLLTYT